MTADKPKRRWFPFWKLPVMPLCPVHGCPCIARGKTKSREWQKRYCPVKGCTHSIKTKLPPV